MDLHELSNIYNNTFMLIFVLIVFLWIPPNILNLLRPLSTR